MPYEELRAFLREETKRCVRSPVGRFRHPWLSPMPPSSEGARWLRELAAGQRGALPEGGDRFALGDYGLGLFHHDVSEAAIALAREPDLVEACFGSLLCFLDCASPDGCVHRIELPTKVRDPEPAKPVIAQLALRALEALGQDGLARFEAHRVLPRVLSFLAYLERTHVGGHGLFLTPSSRASGFDNDLSTANLPDKCVEGPDTNAFMVLEYRAAAELARRLGDDVAAGVLDEKAEALRARMEELLWYEDERGGLYVALRWRHGTAHLSDEMVGHRDPDGVVRPVDTWTGLLPLYAGVPSPARAARLAARALRPEGYLGPHGIRTAPADSPFFSQAARVMLYDPRRGERSAVSNWAGPVWALGNYYLARGLERYGQREAARELDGRTLRLLAADLARTGALHECYDDAGRGLWPMGGGFVSWNVLALVMDG